MKIFVAQLSFNTQSQDLVDVFQEYGEVTSANVIMDKITGRSRGFGFVEMANEEESRKAIQELHETSLDGRELVVKKAEPRRT